MSSQGFQQVQKQVQSMVLAPQLRQSLKILQVPALELRSAILEELQINPALEELPFEDIPIDGQAEDPDGAEEQEDEGEDDAMGKTDSTESAEDSLEFSNDFRVLEKLQDDWSQYLYEEAGEQPYTTADAERRQHFFDSMTSSLSLQESLMEQARLSEDNPQIIEALEFLIGSLDDKGFLTMKLPDVSISSGLPLTRVQAAAKLLQSLEPVGIGCENVQQCLLLQLKVRGRSNSLTATIIRKCWDLLLRRRIPDISRKTGASHEDIQIAIGEIAQLDPAPGKKFASDDNRVIIPDVTVEKDDLGDWQIILNNDYIPRLRISLPYKQLLAQGKLRGKDREYMREKFRSGRFLINAIEQRQQTIERITRQLLVFQNEFFEKGTSALKPLTMSQVAEVVGVHETTISRAISGKFIRTPFGVFEFKFFFTPGYQSNGGQTVSNKSVKEKIARIIESEPPNKPFSDDKVAKILAEEGIRIARRTVAKYREDLGILPTNLRRRYS